MHSAKSSYCHQKRDLKSIYKEDNEVDELDSLCEEDDDDDWVHLIFNPKEDVDVIGEEDDEEDDQDQDRNSHSDGDNYSESWTSCCQHNPDKPSQPQNNMGPNSMLEEDDSAKSSPQGYNDHLNLNSKEDVDKIILEKAHVGLCNSHSECENDEER